MSEDATPIPGGPGWHIDPDSLLPVLTDEQLFRKSCADDPAVEGLVLLWSGRPADAEADFRAVGGTSPSIRLQALILDSRRDQGFLDEAIAGYQALLSEVAGTHREAVIQQHLGKALFAAGRHGEAAGCFEASLRLRVAQGATPDLIASSTQSIARARQLEINET